MALGSAGLVAALDHRPGSAARAELTWAADEAVRGPLDAIVVDLDLLATDFTGLGGQGRGALAALVATDPDALEAALSLGGSLVARIGVETMELQHRIKELPGTGPGAEGRLSAAILGRLSTVTRALEQTGGTARTWATLSNGATVAARLTRLLADHDQSSGLAVQKGSQGNYREALAPLDLADAALAQARSLRDQLANTTDVSTLNQWLDRNAAIDAALRRLYTALSAGGGKVTDDVRRAVDEVRTAQQRLPSDTRALVVIMSDIARAGLNEAVIRIEETRGRLAGIIALLAPAPSPTRVVESPAPGSIDHPEVTPPDA